MASSGGPQANTGKHEISTTGAPAAIGPYSQAVRVGDMLFTSGQVALDPKTGELVPGGITEQTTRVCENLRAVLAKAGLDMSHVVKTTVFLKHMSDFGAMNAVYAKYLAPEGIVAPARSTIQVAGLPKDALVEIEVIARESSEAQPWNRMGRRASNACGIEGDGAMAETVKKIEKTEAEWRQLLTPEQYHVMREKGTERAFTGALVNNHEDGIYRCGACGAELFTSDTKFESGSGWPSFWTTASPDAVELHEDRSYGMRRIEATCAACGAHLGHVFPDGPKPTGQRFCINSASLAFEKQQ
jgi:peptide-methionine (R)-S-oxide reductase